MKKRFLILTAITFTLVLSIFNTSKAKVEQDNIEPNYVRSYFYKAYMRDSGTIKYYVHPGNGYRGYLTRNNNKMTVNADGLTLVEYYGTLYHPSVKNLPMPSNKGTEILTNDEVVQLQENIGAQKVPSKYVRTVRKYYCNPSKNNCKYPSRIFYDYGGYRGYLTHTQSLPVDIGENYVRVTYGGTVYKSSNYPIPYKVDPIFK
ncbi:MAG: hypothetical protein Q4P28_00815 [Tissierellia bacterium]|nr:hypothetical protein [Tissierellia bacterium]